jgi:DNA-binding transcriptional MocR family regulator
LLQSDSGLHVACALNGVRRDTDLEARAKAVGIRLHATDSFAVRPSAHNGFILGLGRIPSDRVDRGVRKLAAAVMP